MASKVSIFLFQPKEGATTTVTNSASATATVLIPPDCDTLDLANSSATATAFIRVTQYLTQAEAAAAVTGNSGIAPTVTTDFPIQPGKQVRRGVGDGYKVFRTIASAADGNLYVTPGTGA